MKINSIFILISLLFTFMNASNLKFIKYNKINKKNYTLEGPYKKSYILKKFIRYMVIKHKFTYSYLNNIFSNVQVQKKALQSMGVGRKKRVRTKARRGGWDRYRNKVLTKENISNGAKFYHKNKKYLKKATEEYGIPPEYISAILGVETKYGGYTGYFKVLDVVTSIGLEHPRRGKYFRRELTKLLLLAKSKKINLDTLQGSYAGAFGWCQFMPSSFMNFSVDFDKDGKVNLFSPADAIGSASNYLYKHKWIKNSLVVFKANFNNKFVKGKLKTGFKHKYSKKYLLSKGIFSKNKYFSKNKGKLSLIKLNRIKNDEYWLGARNFFVITRYNHSNYYAMAVHLLAQEIKKRVKKERK